MSNNKKIFEKIDSGDFQKFGYLSTSASTIEFSGVTINKDIDVKGKLDVGTELFVDKISGETQDTVYYGDGSQLKNISSSDFYATGGTFDNTNGVLTLNRNDGNSFDVSGLTTSNNEYFNANMMFAQSTTITYLSNTSFAFHRFDGGGNSVTEAGFMLNPLRKSIDSVTPGIRFWWVMDGSESATGLMTVNFTTGDTETESFADVVHASTDVTFTGYSGTAWKILTTPYFEIDNSIFDENKVVNVQLVRDTQAAGDDLGADIYIAMAEIKY